MENERVEIPEAAKTSLEDFKKAASEIIKAELEPENSYDDPRIMFHYTDDIGLRGIIGSGSLWLTDMFSLNDPSELHHGYSAATRILAEKAMAEGADFERAFASQFGNNLQDKVRNSGHYFCCSFSAIGDDLGQWRAYANDGKGFSIGFHCARLQGIFAGMQSSAAFPMSYDENLLEKTHQKIVEKFFPLMSNPHALGFQAREVDEYRMCLHRYLALPVLRVALHFKHPAYLNESEYRFLKIQNPRDSNGIKLRRRNYQLIKYIEFDWKSAGEGVLEKIVIGPAADFEKSKRFAEACLRESGIDVASVEITQSNIPYRPT